MDTYMDTYYTSILKQIILDRSGGAINSSQSDTLQVKSPHSCIEHSTEIIS